VRDDFRHFIFRDQRKRAKYGRRVFRQDMRRRDSRRRLQGGMQFENFVGWNISERGIITMFLLRLQKARFLQYSSFETID